MKYNINNAMQCAAKMHQLIYYATAMLLNIGDAPNVKSIFPDKNFSQHFGDFSSISWYIHNSCQNP